LVPVAAGSGFEAALLKNEAKVFVAADDVDETIWGGDKREFELEVFEPDGGVLGGVNVKLAVPKPGNPLNFCGVGVFGVYQLVFECWHKIEELILQMMMMMGRHLPASWAWNVFCIS
jgi:hypothetical protein